MKQMRSSFKEKPGFCGGYDSVIKMVNQKLLALDATNKQLHTFIQDQSIWNTKALADYKVPV